MYGMMPCARPWAEPLTRGQEGKQDIEAEMEAGRASGGWREVGRRVGSYSTGSNFEGKGTI